MRVFLNTVVGIVAASAIVATLFAVAYVVGRALSEVGIINYGRRRGKAEEGDHFLVGAFFILLCCGILLLLNLLTDFGAYLINLVL